MTLTKAQHNFTEITTTESWASYVAESQRSEKEKDIGSSIFISKGAKKYLRQTFVPFVLVITCNGIAIYKNSINKIERFRAMNQSDEVVNAQPHGLLSPLQSFLVFVPFLRGPLKAAVKETSSLTT